jgi:hypothetical protein
VAEPELLFQVLENGESKGGFPNLWQAALTWNENASKRKVIRIDGEGKTLQEYTAAQCREALRNALNPKIGRR